MKLFIFILLMWVVWLAWVWPKTPAWKRTPARAYPAGPDKSGLKPTFASRLEDDR